MSRRRTPWRAVAAMFLLNGALFGIWASRIPAVADTHALDKAALGLLLLCLAGGAIAAFPLAGRAADRYGAARVTRVLAGAYALSLIAVAISPSVAVLALTLLIFGAMLGGMDVAMNAWAAEVERARGRSTMASFHAMFSLGAGLGAATGYGAAANGLGVPAHFAGGAVALAALTVPLAAIEWRSAAPPDPDKAPVFAVPRSALLAVGVVAFCSAFGEGAMADWSAVFLVSVTAVSEAQAALGYAVFSAAMVAMRLVGDRVIVHLGPARAARYSAATAALGALLAALGGTFPTALAGFALMGLGYAVIFPLAFSRAANDGTTGPGAAIAGVATLGYGGMLLGPPLIGFVAHATSLQTAFLLLSAAAGLIAVLSGALARDRPAAAVPARVGV